MTMPRDGAADPVARSLSKIFCERASFELKDDDIQAYRNHIRQQAANIVAKAQEDEEYLAWKAKYPCVLEGFASFAALANAKRVAVFLDYDGTLTPIVKNPDRAYMSDQMRDAVRDVARLFPTAIISGRGREKVEDFVHLKELYYAGSHGMDIIGPRGEGDEDGSELAFQPAARFGPVMDQIHDDLVARVAGIEGATVEHNKFCVSVHFRNCRADQYDAVLAAVETTLRGQDELHATRGRKVFEIRPQVDWDKGHALLHLLAAMGLDVDDDVLPIYIGDDRTDEDAFRALRSRAKGGLGILVSSKAKPTEAVYTLRDPTEVQAFLSKIISWGHTPANAWHQKQSCTGWAMDPSVGPPLTNGYLSHTSSGELPGSEEGEKALSTAENFTKASSDGARNAFGLKVPRGSGLNALGGRSPMVRSGRPPLAPSTPSSVSSSGFLDGLMRPSPSKASGEAAAPRASQVSSSEDANDGDVPSVSVDLAQLSVKDNSDDRVLSAVTSAGAASSTAENGGPSSPKFRLANGFSPFSILSGAPNVLAGLGLPGEEGTASARGSSTLSGAYSSGGDSMHFTASGTLVTDSETGKAA
ncbi:g2256 [Coccomyxa elongata]